VGLRKHYISVAGLLMGMLAAAAPRPAGAGLGSSVRALGMGGAYTALARGIDAPQWNPANLALTAPGRVSVGLLAGAATVDNNSFSLGLYNRLTGADLNDQDKLDILAAIPPEGMAATADATASALGLQLSHFAFTVSGRAAARSNVPHDAFTLLLFGNAAADSVTLDDAAVEAYALASVALSGATTVLGSAERGLHVGLSLRYLHGIAYGRLTQAAGALLTRPTGVFGQAVAEAITTGSGDGVGVDLGLAATAGRWTGGLMVENAFAQIAFNRDVERRTWTVALDTVTVSTLQNQGNLDHLVTHGESVREAGPVVVTLPRVVSLGLGRTGRLASVAVDLSQGFAERAGSDTATRLSAGLELFPARVVSLRAGAAAGGASGWSASAGLGLRLLAVRIDLAAATHGALVPGSPRGVSAAVGLGLGF
jgi:hypothetical protein